MQKKFFKQAAFMVLILCVAGQVFSQKSKKITWGIYGGWSWGTGYAFRWHISPYSYRHTLQYHLGGIAQLNLSPYFGLQLDANYQSGLFKWTLQHPSFPHDSGDERFDFASLSIKGIYNLPKWGQFQLYLTAGGGISNGQWDGFDGIYYNLTAGPGIKLFFGGSDSNMALNLGSTFVYLFELDELDSYDVFYVRLNFGLEF